VAHRFEVYGAGLELGNGYLELADPDEYERRFDGENAKRRSRGKPELPKDAALLADLRRGLPPCAGVAMGVDRLVQWGMGLATLDPVLSFPWEKA
jgi:lysyl-tRNA synthetase class 2